MQTRASGTDDHPAWADALLMIESGEAKSVIVSTRPRLASHPMVQGGTLEVSYTPGVFTTKVRLVFDHVLTAYGDNGESAYGPRPDFQFSQDLKVEYADPVDVNKIADDVGRAFTPTRLLLPR